MNGTEILGFAASLLIATAMAMTKLKRIRTVGLMGSLTMAVYGGLIGSVPVLGVNVLIAVTHAFYLYKLLRSSTLFDLNPILGRTPFVGKFFDYYGADIARSHPGFDFAKIDRTTGFFVLRDLITAGVFLYSEEPDGSLRVHLDYVTPSYRDLKNAAFMYAELDRFIDCRHLHRVVVRTDYPPLVSYFGRAGFTPCPDEPGQLERPLDTERTPPKGTVVPRYPE